MTLLSTPRKVMAYARNIPKVVEQIYKELTKLDGRVSANEPRKEIIVIAADALADDEWEIAVGHPPITGRIASAYVIPDTDIGQATNFMTISLINKKNTGEGTDVLGTRDVNSTNTIKAFLGANLISTIPDVDVAHGLSLKKEVTGDGQKWPGGVLEITYLPPSS